MKLDCPEGGKKLNTPANVITDDFLPASDSHVKAIYNTARITALKMKRMITNANMLLFRI